ncbi:MAG: transporter related protein, partial [Thermoleophilia bacterium]|nr:transporter related protein [Thermoleophilia bacterium]
MAANDPPNSTPVGERDGFVHVRGARQHNLRGIDVDIPRDSLVAFTGVSGSGKSSLAFGTIYAEAQRRYFESVAPYARRLLHQIGAPKVDDISGLPPAVALQQRRGAPSSRSTVGTITTIANSLRMLLSRAGTYPPDIDERLDSDAFSPNTAVGACPACHGIGVVHEATEASMVHDPSLTIAERAVTAWPGAWQFKNQRDILTVLGHDVNVPWRELPAELRDWILFTEDEPVVTVVPERRPDQSHRPYKGTFMSARRYIRKALTMSQSAAQRRRALQFVETTQCPACHGSRLRPDALAVTFAGRNIAEWNAIPLRDLGDLLAPTVELAAPDAAYRAAQSGETSEVAQAIAEDLCARIEPLVDLGLGYLSLDRATPTLSPGELQRLRIATQVRSGLFGVVYVLDEPSAGLHPADTEPLLDVLDRIRTTGNSLFVVEHDLDVVRRADWIVDIGPGAGEGGGELLYSGPVDGLRSVENSRTARYLFPHDDLSRRVRERRAPSQWIRMSHVTRHNLVDVAADVPLGVLTAVTGVSGSGKSTLVTQVLAAVVARELGTPVDSGTDTSDVDESDEAGIADDTLPDDAARGVTASGAGAVDRLIQVDQKPIG